jgi:hypothetical protein
LLIGAGLLVELRASERGEPGVLSRSRAHVHPRATGSAQKTSASVSQFIDSHVRRLEGEAGVTSAAAVFGLPLDGESTPLELTRPGEVDRADSSSLGMRVVTADYFRR